MKNMKINERKTALVTGCAGMDGSYLCEKLLNKRYKVIGIDRWNATGMSPNMKTFVDNPNFEFVTGDITERDFIYRLFRDNHIDYFYNMAAISLVPESFKIPQKVFEINTIAVINILEIIRSYSPHTRFYQASTSEQIGKNTEPLQNTESKMIPNSPYAIAKLASYHMVRLYREAYGLFACNGMLWNHEGPRRGPTFVTRKITIGVANIFRGWQDVIELGNLDSGRDWGHADDYTDAMIMMMEAEEADDYAVATGETHTVREFVDAAFEAVDMDITWEGEGFNEVAKDKEGKVVVKINPNFYRPAEVPNLNGDPSKIKEKLGWEPKIKFKELVKEMMKGDLNY